MKSYLLYLKSGAIKEYKTVNQAKSMIKRYDYKVEKIILWSSSYIYNEDKLPIKRIIKKQELDLSILK